VETSIGKLHLTKEWDKIFDNLNPEITDNVFKRKYILSHQILYTNFYKIEIQDTNDFLVNNYKSTGLTELDTLSTPRLLEIYFEFINK